MKDSHPRILEDNRKIKLDFWPLELPPKSEKNEWSQDIYRQRNSPTPKNSQKKNRDSQLRSPRHPYFFVLCTRWRKVPNFLGSAANSALIECDGALFPGVQTYFSFSRNFNVPSPPSFASTKKRLEMLRNDPRNSSRETSWDLSHWLCKVILLAVWFSRSEEDFFGPINEVRCTFSWHGAVNFLPYLP